MTAHYQLWAPARRRFRSLLVAALLRADDRLSANSWFSESRERNIVRARSWARG